jgi:alpha-soluble NSF attachment protein
MAEYLQKARGLAAAADRKLLSFGFFSNKHEEAAELYESAANQFKLAKAWQEAGDVLVKLADLSGGKLESKHDAAAALVEAAKAYGKLPDGAGSARALKCLRSAVSLYTEMGRLGMAARQLREAAEVAERAGERGDARLFYEQVRVAGFGGASGARVGGRWALPVHHRARALARARGASLRAPQS